jgi:hypothetical protein
MRVGLSADGPDGGVSVRRLRRDLSHNEPVPVRTAGVGWQDNRPVRLIASNSAFSGGALTFTRLGPVRRLRRPGTITPHGQ